MRWLDAITNLMDMSLSRRQERVKDREACSPRGRKESDMTKRLNNRNPHLSFFLMSILKMQLLLRMGQSVERAGI